MAVTVHGGKTIVPRKFVFWRDIFIELGRKIGNSTHACQCMGLQFKNYLSCKNQLEKGQFLWFSSRQTARLKKKTLQVETVMEGLPMVMVRVYFFILANFSCTDGGQIRWLGCCVFGVPGQSGNPTNVLANCLCMDS